MFLSQHTPVGSRTVDVVAFADSAASTVSEAWGVPRTQVQAVAEAEAQRTKEAHSQAARAQELAKNEEFAAN